MGYSIRLLGKFSLSRALTEESIPTRSYGRIYALLALHLDSGISRKELSQRLWPELEVKTASNRLRVALSTFRREFGSAFVEKGEQLGFDPSQVSVDYIDLLAVLDSIQDEVDEEHERKVLEEKTDLLSKGLLPEFRDEWVEEWRANWMGTALEALRRLSQLAAKTDDHRLIIRASEAAFEHDSYDDALWREYLQASALLGEKSKALARFASVRRTYMDHFGSDFEPETVEYASNLRDSPFSFAAKGEQPLTSKEIELYSRVVSVVLKDDPDIARALFGSRSTFFEEANVTAVSLPLLTRLSQDTNDRSLAWQKCTLNLLSLYANQGDLPKIFELSQQILGVSTDPIVRGTTLAYLSYTHLIRQDYAEALSTSERCIETLVESDHDDEAKVFYLNKASALFGLGRYDEVVQLSQEAIDYFSQQEGAIAQIRVCENRHTLAFIYAVQEDYEKAYAQSRISVDILLGLKYEPSYGNQLSFGSYLSYMVTRNPTAIDTLILSLKTSYRSGNVMIQQRALDYCAGLLQEAGFKKDAGELIDFCDEWRRETEFPRPIWHQILVDRIRAACGPFFKSDFPYAKNPREAIMYAIQLLRKVGKDPGPS